MKTRMQSFLLMLAGATVKELARQVQFLKEEIHILRAHLPKKIVLTPQEKRRLLRFGKPLGKAINDLITIVSPRTFARWVSAEKAPADKQPPERKPGQPRTNDQIRDLILRMAEENAWGYSRILGELRKLGINNVSRNTIANILKANGYEAGPKRGPGLRGRLHLRRTRNLDRTQDGARRSCEDNMSCIKGRTNICYQRFRNFP
jgi:putative transposase